MFNGSRAQRVKLKSFPFFRKSFHFFLETPEKSGNFSGKKRNLSESFGVWKQALSKESKIEVIIPSFDLQGVQQILWFFVDFEI